MPFRFCFQFSCILFIFFKHIPDKLQSLYNSIRKKGIYPTIYPPYYYYDYCSIKKIKNCNGIFKSIIEETKILV